jgi:hypothetical protein
MDPTRFDALIRALSAGANRRGVLSGLGASVLAGLVGWAPVAGKGKNRRRHQRDQRQRRRAKAKERRQDQDQESAAEAKQCRGQGHPCEGNQRCCAPFVCVVSGPGNAERCTPCPSGTVFFEGACCTPTTCAAEDAECGQIGDGCGGTLECGTGACPQPDNPCQEAVCEANVCATRDRLAGTPCGSDACSACDGTGACVGCAAPEFCGGGGVPGVCGNTPGGTCPPGSDFCSTNDPDDLHCNAGDDCLCDTTTEGATVCRRFFVGDCQACTGSAECGEGKVCVVPGPICRCGTLPDDQSYCVSLCPPGP